MRHSILRVVCILLALVLVPLWALAEEGADVTVADEAVAADSAASYILEGKVFPHLRQWSKDAPVNEGEITLYFVNGGDIPYIALSDFMAFLAGLETEAAEWEDISYDVLAGENGMFMVSRADNDAKMVVDAGKDSILFTNFDMFVNMPGSSSLVNVIDLPQPTKLTVNEKIDIVMKRIEEGNPMTDEEVKKFMSEEAEASEDLFTLATMPFNRSGAMLDLDLAAYNLDMIAQDGQCYIPFQTLNDIFIPPFYVTYVFNGQALIGSGWGADFANRMYEAAPEAMSEEFAAFNFRELCFNLDHFYGLREEHGIGKFVDMLAQNYDLFTQLRGTDPEVFDSALNVLTATYLDDGHSGFKKFSWRTGDKTGAEFAKTLANVGISSIIRLGASFSFQQERAKAYPDGIPKYEEIGDTAFITFNEFSVKRERSEDYYNIENPDDPQDTIELIMYANRQIKREGSPVKNIVIDLSMNGGGNASAAVFATAWFAGNAIIDLKNPLTGAESIVAYKADVNLNGLTTNDPGDSVAHGYNLYCLTSSQSFSCGNLLPGCFRESGIVTLIGRTSGGGSCVVRPCTTASGAFFQLSGIKQLSTVINGSFYNIDQGIEPDIYLSKVSSFYDRQGLVDLIHEHK